MIVPRAIHGPGFVHVSADQVGEAAHQARARRLVLLAQVHSHPGDDTRHSDADDSLVLMAREDMFSLVAAHYGDRALTLAEGVGIHQFQDARWIQVSDAETALIILPAGGPHVSAAIRERFYVERDLRTSAYGVVTDRLRTPVRIKVGADAAESPRGRHSRWRWST